MSRGFRMPNWLSPALCVVCGATGAVLVWGGQSADRVVLNQQVDRFRALTEEQQRAVRLSFADLSAQSASRRSAIRSVHEAVQQDAGLRDVLDRYFHWWSALDQNDWDAFLKMEAEDRLSFARSRMNTHADPAKQIVVEFDVSYRLPALHMTLEEFGRMIAQALADVKRPPSLQDELKALSSEQHRTLRLALWMFDNLWNPRDEAEADRREKVLRSAVLDNVSDTVWKTRFTATLESFSGKRFERVWVLRTLLAVFGRATTAMGEDLRRQYPVTDRQIKDAFASLDSKEQHSLMTMSSGDARRRLQFLAQTTGAHSAEEKLFARCIEFEKKREGLFNFATFGFGGTSRFQPGQAGASGGKQAERRDPPQD